MVFKWLMFSLAITVIRGETIEHVGIIIIHPYDKVFYYLQVVKEHTNPLLVWLGHTPGHSLNHRTNNTAIPSFDKNISFLMFDLPGVGETISSSPNTLSALSLYAQIVLACIKDSYNNYTFTDIWIGGEKLMTPLVITLADKLHNVVGLILGNPYLSPEISLSKCPELLSQLGYLDPDKEDQYVFLDERCKTNGTVWNCYRADELLQLTTNKSIEHNNWSKNYIESIIETKDYLQIFLSLLKSRKYKVLLYIGQLDYSTSFKEVYGVMKDFGICNDPEPFKYYMYEKEVKGFYRQNECWSLLQLYNASENITQFQGEVVGKIIKEFIKNGKLNCEGKDCNMEDKIKSIFPNCYIDNWRSERYSCECTNGKYGATCSITIENSYNTTLYPGEVKYFRYNNTEDGYLELVKSNDDCKVDMYANICPITNLSCIDLPNERHFDLHTNKNKVYVFKGKIIIIKVKSMCNELIEMEMKYVKQEKHNVLVYLVLTCVLVLLILVFCISMLVIQLKFKKNRQSSLIKDNTSCSL